MGFLGGAALLTAAVAVSKLLGALYKIPLGNLLGSRGMGCFQVAYNVYGVLLTLSTAGLPLAMSRLIAQSRGRPRRQRRIFHVALALFLALGLVGSGVMLTFPRQLSGLLHNELAAPSIRVLAPALLAVCLLSAIRGYTQGQGQMLPTAVSQVVESAGKLVVGLGLTWYLLTVRGVSPEIGAAGAMAGVTAGSLLALLVLALRWLPSCMGSDAPPSRREVLGQLLKIGVPITLGAGGMSFITLLDQSVAMDALQSRLAAHQRRSAEPHTAQNGPHCPRRALGKHRKTSAAADEQLQHIPHDLGQVAIRAKQEVVQITEDQLVGKGLVHGFFLLSVARKRVKYSGNSESNRRCSPVIGCTKPSVLACRHCPCRLVMQLCGPYTGSPATGCWMDAMWTRI